MFIELIGEARCVRYQRGVGFGHTFDRQRIQIRNLVTRLIRIRGRRMYPLLLAAQMRQYCEPAAAVATFAQQSRHLARSACVRTQHQQLDARLNEGLHQRQWSSVQTQALYLLCRPAESRAGQAERGRRRNDSHRFLPEMLDQDGADPIAGRIPGREHADRTAAKPVEGLGQRTEGCWPGDVLALFSRPQQIEVALPADQHPRLLDHQARRGRQSFRAVVTHTHHCEPVLHLARGPDKALTAAAAMALPPRRPRRVTKGTSSPASTSASFEVAAPTKPTGKAKIAAGRTPGASASILKQPEQRSRCVADGDHRVLQMFTPELHRGSGTGGPLTLLNLGDTRVVQAAQHRIP